MGQIRQFKAPLSILVLFLFMQIGLRTDMRRIAEPGLVFDADDGGGGPRQLFWGSASAWGDL